MRSLAVLLLVFAPLTPAGADENDDWTGEWVLPRKQEVALCDKDGKPLGTSFATAGKVLSTGKTHLQVRNSLGRDHHEGYVSKTDVVKLADAVALFTDAIRKDEKSVWAWRMRGEARVLKKELDSAIKDFTEAIRLDPKDAVAFMGRGEASTYALDFDGAIKDLTEAIRLDPKEANAFLCRGNAWALKMDFDKAMKDFDEAIRLDPKNAAALMDRGSTWLQQGNFDKALRDYDEAIRLDPKNASCFLNRGQLWFDKGEYDKALKDCDEAIRLDPKDVAVFALRGSVWGRKRDYDKAIKDYTVAIQLDPKHAESFIHRGDVWLAKGEYDKATKDYTEALRLDPKNDRTLGDLAWRYATCWDAKFRDGKKAVTYATKACELTDWKDNYALAVLAAAYAESGDFEKAVKYQKQVLEDKDLQKEEVEKLRMNLKLYEQKKAFRESKPDQEP